MLVSSVANAVALLHLILDPRTPLVSRESVMILDVAEAKNDVPKNFWESTGKLLEQQQWMGYLQGLLRKAFWDETGRSG